MSLTKKKDLRLGLEFLEGQNNTFTSRGMQSHKVIGLAANAAATTRAKNVSFND